MNPLFVDTSGFAALATSTYILDELFTLLRMRWNHPTAVKAGDTLSRTHWCRVLDVSDATRAAAWQIFVRYSDQMFSYTNCTTFALMHEMELSEAFTFDRRDFAAAGFTPVP